MIMTKTMNSGLGDKKLAQVTLCIMQGEQRWAADHNFSKTLFNDTERLTKNSLFHAEM